MNQAMSAFNQIGKKAAKDWFLRTHFPPIAKRPQNIDSKDVTEGPAHAVETLKAVRVSANFLYCHSSPADGDGLCERDLSVKFLDFLTARLAIPKQDYEGLAKKILDTRQKEWQERIQHNSAWIELFREG